METINTIQCPYCNCKIEPWEYVETGDMDGSFKMECEKCKKPFIVNFKTDIIFNTFIE